MIDNERRQELNQTKFDVLLRKAFPDSQFEKVHAKSAAVRSNGQEMYVYAPDQSISPLAIAMALPLPETKINVVLDEPDSLLILQAEGLKKEYIFWIIEDETMVYHPDEDYVAQPVKHILDAPIISILEANNCDIVHEHEIVKAEIKGLEVARITEDRDGELKLQIGVGHYDQEAHKLVDLHEDPNEKLARVVADVLRYRNKEAKPHPLNRVARPAWLVSEIIAFPEKLNLQDVHRLMTPGKATTVKETTPAAALAKSDGKIVLLVASVGIDLKAIPLAAALSATEDADEIWMILPEKDFHPALKRQSSQLTIPVYFKTVQEPWPATLG